MISVSMALDYVFEACATALPAAGTLFLNLSDLGGLEQKISFCLYLRVGHLK